MQNKSQITREVKLFEFYRDYAWPVHRKFIKSYISERCSKCGVSSNYTKLSQGSCDPCRQSKPEKSIDENRQKKLNLELKKLLDSYSGQGEGQYDALILFSGGKDSSFLVHRLQEEYPHLRLLALTVDNTFMSPIAMDNASSIIDTLNVDSTVIRPNNQVMGKMFASGFRNLNDKGCSGTVDQFDGDFFCDVARNYAANFKIPLVICGLSKTQVERIIQLEHFETPEEDEKKKRVNVGGINLTDIFTDTEMKYWWNGEQPPNDFRPRMIYPYYAWDMDEEFIKSEVQRLGLMRKGHESPLLTNNALIPLMGIVDMIEYGYSSFEPEFCEMIRNGKADRKNWVHTFELLEYASKTGRFISSSLDEVLDRLGLTRKELGIKGGR